MTVKERKLLISAVSFVLLMFLCYGAFPRHPLQVSGSIGTPITLIIDAGHGGEDGGALSDSGVRECDLNLSVALRAEQLSALVGICPVMVRRTDISVHDEGCVSISEKKSSDLRNRVKLVEETPGAVLLSIHQNHFSQSKYYGAQVFYASTAGSDILADVMQDDLKSVLDHGNHRKPKKSDKVYLMDHIRCPGVLVECGFLSNGPECEKLQQSDYQKKLTLAILRSITQKGNGVLAQDEI